MKRIILDGLVVENVDVPPEGAEGFLVPDDTYVGPGFTWNGDAENPVFTPPEDEA